MASESKLQQAREKLDKLIQSIDRVIAVHELNAHFQYSRDFVLRVNRSFASNSYIVIQNELMASELIGVCRIWDKSDPDSFSLPSIVALAEAGDVREALENEVASGSCYNLKAEHARARNEKWITLSNRVKQTRESDRYLRTVNHRNKHLAHLLEVTQREKSGKIEAETAVRYGDEKFLLDEAKHCITELFSLVQDGYINLDSYTDQHTRHAKLFADSAKFLTTQEFNALKN
jgi:AbiU2